MCGYGQLVTSLMQLDLSVSLFSICSVQFSPFSRVHLFAKPWTAACQASLSITNSRSLLKLMSIDLVMPSNHLILSSPSLPASIVPNISIFQMTQFFPSGGQIIGASASASVLPVNIQDWLYLGWIGLISSRSKGLSRVFSNTIV